MTEVQSLILRLLETGPCVLFYLNRFSGHQLHVRTPQGTIRARGIVSNIDTACWKQNKLILPSSNVRALETTRSQRTSVQTPASLPRGHVIFERTGC